MKSNRPLLLQAAVGELWCGVLREHGERHREYCRRQGYEYQAFEMEKTSDFDQFWYRIPPLVEALKDERWSHVFFLDADTLVVDVEKDMRQTAPEPYWLGLTMHPYPSPWDACHFQTGVMYVRTCEESVEFFERVLSKRYEMAWKSGWHDQQAINDLLLHDPRWQSGVRVLDHRWNNNLHDQSVEAPIVAAWHGVGSGEERRELMRLYSRDHPVSPHPVNEVGHFATPLP